MQATATCVSGDVMAGDNDGNVVESISAGTRFVPWVFDKDKGPLRQYPICGHYTWDNNNAATTFCKKLGFEKGEGRHRHHRVRNKFKTDAMPVGRCRQGQELNKCNAGGNGWGNLGYRRGFCKAGKKIGVQFECSGGSFKATQSCTKVHVCMCACVDVCMCLSLSL